MVRVVTQETFNEVVKENMEEFSMTPEEAVEDAVQQFIAQGVDLSNIVKEMATDALRNSEKQSLLQVITNIGDLLKARSPSPELAQQLVYLTEECDKSLAHKILAAKNGAYSIIMATLEMFSTNRDMTYPALNALIALMTGQPDLLDQRGITLMINYLDTRPDLATRQQVLKWAKQCCLKHEKNRQDIFNRHILSRLQKMLDIESTSAPLVRDVCGVIFALVLDDDIRVEYGNAHEHARTMANEVLCTITDLLKRFQGDKETVADLLLTLTALIVRNEFCEKVEEAGGVTFLLDVFINHPESEKLNRLSLKLLKALAGNDNVKDRIIKAGVAPLITFSMNKHRTSASLTAAGCACISALSLRSPVNSRALCDAGAAEAVVQGMKVHPNDLNVQKQGSWAMRNIVSRERTLTKEFLDLGAEEILHLAEVNHGDKCDYDIKAALRDLGCKVDLKERWTGKGGALN